MALDPAREKNLDHLPVVGALAQAERVARELLRDRAGALPDAPRAPVLRRRAQHPVVVHAVMLEKARVLRRHQRLHQFIGQIAQRHRVPVFKKDAPDHRARPVEDRARRLHLLEFFQVELRRLFLELGLDRQKINEPRDHSQHENRQRGEEPRTAVKSGTGWLVVIPHDSKSGGLCFTLCEPATWKTDGESAILRIHLLRLHEGCLLRHYGTLQRQR